MNQPKILDHTGIELNGVANALMLLDEYVRRGILTPEDAEPLIRNLKLFERYVLAWKDFGDAVSWHDVKTNPQNFKSMAEYNLTTDDKKGRV